MKYPTEYRLLDVAKLQPALYNPREEIRPGTETYESLRRSIVEHGLTEPLVVNLHNMCCIGGSQRLAVIRDLGWPQVLCSVINQPDELQEKKLCLALNRIDGRWDEAKLAELLRDDEVLAYETGFGEAEIALYQELAEVSAADLPVGSDDIEDNIDELAEDLTAELAVNEDLAEAEAISVTVKIGHLSFKCEAVLYEQLLGSMRDRGIFEIGRAHV